LKFLIDECLHTSLVEVAVACGHEAAHINWRGLSGVSDRSLMQPIREGDFTFVTNNARETIHAGLVILIPNVTPTLQRALFATVLDVLGPEASLINEALELSIVDGEVRLDRYDWPALP
jgi:predicted nuclease of predicted toxin-antitoxin system